MWAIKSQRLAAVTQHSLCQANVTGEVNYSGPASFNFEIKSNSKSSGFKTASFTILDVDDPPTAGVSVPAGEMAIYKDQKSWIRIDSTDPEGLLPSSCTATASPLSNASLTQCTCYRGVCYVGVTGTAGSGTVSFSYKVTVNGEQSSALNFSESAAARSSVSISDQKFQIGTELTLATGLDNGSECEILNADQLSSSTCNCSSDESTVETSDELCKYTPVKDDAAHRGSASFNFRIKSGGTWSRLGLAVEKLPTATPPAPVPNSFNDRDGENIRLGWKEIEGFLKEVKVFTCGGSSEVTSLQPNSLNITNLTATLADDPDDTDIPKVKLRFTDILGNTLDSDCTSTLKVSKANFPPSQRPYFKELSSGFQHSCALSTGGHAYCWGNNGKGQLGDETTDSSSTPVKVTSSLGFTSISAGKEHTCAIANTGASYCWGNNGNGQVGRGGSSGGISKIPQLVDTGGMSPTDTKARYFTALSAGASHTCGIAMDGTLWCWGDDSKGQLGNGSETGEKSAPFKVDSDKRFISVASGSHHSCAITSEGVVMCWGDNASGQLGIGNTMDQATPSQVDSSRIHGSTSQQAFKNLVSEVIIAAPSRQPILFIVGVKGRTTGLVN